MDAGRAADESAYLRTAKSCGLDAPTLVSSFAEAIPRGDGGKQARSPGRARYKPLKPLRGECRVNRCDRGDYARMLILFCMRGCGCIARPAFPAPSVLRGQNVEAKLARNARRDREAISRRHCEEQRDEAIHVCFLASMDCFANA